METDRLSKEPFFLMGDLLWDKNIVRLHRLVFARKFGVSNAAMTIGPQNINAVFAEKFSGKIGLVFVPERKGDGNLCMADSREVMPEFRGTCTPIDLLNYVLGVLGSLVNFQN